MQVKLQAKIRDNEDMQAADLRPLPLGSDIDENIYWFEQHRSLFFPSKFPLPGALIPLPDTLSQVLLSLSSQIHPLSKLH